LATLVSSTGTWNTPFNTNTFAGYIITVERPTASLTLTGTPLDPNGSVLRNGLKTLSVGDNVFVITGVGEDGLSQVDYTVTVRRLGSHDATLSDLTSSSGTWNIPFTRYTYNYTITIPYITTVVTLAGTPFDSNYSSMTNNSGDPLPVGTTTLWVRVVAEDGYT
jgi:hypothetical protein